MDTGCISLSTTWLQSKRIPIGYRKRVYETYSRWTVCYWSLQWHAVISERNIRSQSLLLFGTRNNNIWCIVGNAYGRSNWSVARLWGVSRLRTVWHWSSSRNFCSGQRLFIDSFRFIVSSILMFLIFLQSRWYITLILPWKSHRYWRLRAAHIHVISLNSRMLSSIFS